MKGYKVFNNDWTCRNFQYEVGKTYDMDATEIKLCGRGFHFCERIIDCFSYYDFDPKNKVAEVEALGAILTDGVKSCTNKIKIVRELTWHEVLDLVNIGKDCTGNRNSGDWNRASNSVGCFNTEDRPLFFFDEPTDMTFEQWRSSDAYWLLNKIDFRPADWIWFDEMSDEEKEQHSEAQTTDGYLKIRDNSDCCKEWWNGLSDKEKDIIKAIPNFDPDKFFEITGIRVED